MVFSLFGTAVLASYCGAFALQLGRPLIGWAPWFGLGILPVLLLKLGTAYYLGIHREMWRYAGLRDIVATGQLVVATSLVIGVTAAALPAPEWLLSIAAHDMMLSAILLTAVRMAPRLFLEFGTRGTKGRRVVVLGAGNAAEALVRELQRSSTQPFTPVAILDDDPGKLGQRIHGIPVVGTLDDVGAAAREYGAEVLLLAIYAISGERLHQIRAGIADTGLPMKQVPALSELLNGRARIDQLREFSLEELLNRAPVRTDRAAIGALIADSCVLVTGAAGSIGSELSRQLLAAGPTHLILLDNSESALFYIEQELRPRCGQTRLTSLLCSVTDFDKLDAVFAEHCPNVVFHAAAYKHVPVLEHFPEEAVRTNVGGTLNLASVAHAHGCERFVLISTDKAVRPTSVMGTTKRVAELIVADFDRRSATRFTTLRFGNVLGSNGSVVELFRRQIARGGPVTVTHPEMRRFFMSIHEAVELVLFATAMDTEGGTFILNMGEQVRILDLARHFIRLHGIEPGVDIPIEFTGLRPGEKLYEELWTDAERPSATEHPEILRAPRLAIVHEDLAGRIDALLATAGAGDRDRIIAALRALVPAYSGDPVYEPAPQRTVDPKPAELRLKRRKTSAG